MDQEWTTILSMPRSIFDALESRDNRPGPGLSDCDGFHASIITKTTDRKQAYGRTLNATRQALPG